MLDGLTLRELVWMADGRQSEAWNHTASLLAMLANIYRDTKKRPRPFQMQNFHPHLAQAAKRSEFDGAMRVLSACLPRGSSDNYPWLPGEREERERKKRAAEGGAA